MKPYELNLIAVSTWCFPAQHGKQGTGESKKAGWVTSMWRQLPLHMDKETGTGEAHKSLKGNPEALDLCL